MALTVSITGRAGRRLSGSVWGGIIAAVSLDSCSKCVVYRNTSQYPTTDGTLHCTRRIERLAVYRDDPNNRTLATFALAFGLGLAHHPSLTFPGVFFAIYLLTIDPTLIREPRRWFVPMLIAFAAGFLPWLYLPLRAVAGAPLAPDNLTTWSGFLDHVLARGFCR